MELILVTPTDTCYPSVVVTYEQRRMLFNCGEGMQRVANEKKIKLSKLTNVFMMKNCSETLSGLGGMMLTLADVEACRQEDLSKDNWKYQLEICGPPGIADFVHALRYIYKREHSNIRVWEVDSPTKEIIGEDGLRVLPILLQAKSLANQEHVTGKCNESDAVEPATKRPRIQEGCRKESYSVPSKFGTLEILSTNPDRGGLAPAQKQSSVCYAITAPPKRGRFRRDKALELGVPKGPEFGKLVKGESVVTPSGRVVRPEECMEVAEIEQSVLLVCCPSVDLVDALVSSSAWSSFFKNEGLLFVVHFSPTEVLQHPRYIEWMRLFCSNSLEHILVNDAVCSNELVFHASATLTKNLSTELGELFSEDQSGLEGTFPMGTPLTKSLPELANGNNFKVQAGKMMQQLVVHPPSKRGIHLPIKELTLKERKARPKSSEWKKFEITFLGTGSAIPSKYRNVSSIFLRTSKTTACLLDCGEGSLSQLVRKFGLSECQDIVKNQLRLVWISHMHADHHLGLLRILSVRDPSETPLVVIGPDSLEQFLADCAVGDSSIQRCYKFFPITRSSEETTVFETSEGDSKCETINKLLEDLQVDRIVCVPVIHCSNSYGAVFELVSNGGKIVYSGDTEPCPALVLQGKGADVLIHEATFETEKAADARAKRHSTTSEAITVGSQMEAEYTILTHFSQRYPKASPVGVESEMNSVETRNTKTILAFDLMTVTDLTLEKASQIGHVLENLQEETEENFQLKGTELGELL